MGKGGQGTQESNAKGGVEVQKFGWEEVRGHKSKTDKWIVIDGQVYNISTWAQKHPGGSRVISHYAGQDATDAFRAFHNDLDFVKKYMKPIHLGSIKPEEQQICDIDKDFRELRSSAEKMGLFKPSYWYYLSHIVYILAFEVLAYQVLRQFGVGWIPLIASLLLNTIVQEQSAYLQHDFGHLSVFHDIKLDYFCHYFCAGIMKGVSPNWWNHMHYQHHAKPNVMDKDPDMRLENLFVVGNEMPVKIAKQWKKSMPYNWQHRYFFLVGPPLLFPVYFHFTLFHHVFTRKLWKDLAITIFYFFRFFSLYAPLLGWSVLPFYFAMRCLESHWFTWCSQMSHVPMEVKAEKEEPWFKMHLVATCNVDRSFFNDWFTGHLNFQIEHHLFPTMPRHNLYKVAPLVRSMCEKHGIDYKIKPLSTAFADVIRTLHKSGELWQATYQEFHSTMDPSS